jgi:hypothetical protein
MHTLLEVVKDPIGLHQAIISLFKKLWIIDGRVFGVSLCLKSIDHRPCIALNFIDICLDLCLKLIKNLN